jgi:hypothetical protein
MKSKSQNGNSDRNPVGLKERIWKLFDNINLPVMFLKRTNAEGAARLSEAVKKQLQKNHIDEEEFEVAINAGDIHTGGLDEWYFGGPGTGGQANAIGPGGNVPPRTTPQNTDPGEHTGGDWQGNNKDPISAVLGWLVDKKTRDGRGFATSTISTRTRDIFVIWESPDAICDISGGFASVNLGTYVVNGGNCSTVIDFQPDINFSGQGQAVPSGGGLTTVYSQPTHMNRDCAVTGSSTPVYLHASKEVEEKDGEQAGREAAKAFNANLTSSLSVLGFHPVKAKLIVQGDPRFGTIPAILGSHLTVIVINPFHLRTNSKNTKERNSQGEVIDCGDWLARPPCNEFLTNTRWQILGVDQQIRQGSFRTTFSLILRTPGVTLDCRDTLGGDPAAPRLSDYGASPCSQLAIQALSRPNGNRNTLVYPGANLARQGAGGRPVRATPSGNTFGPDERPQ